MAFLRLGAVHLRDLCTPVDKAGFDPHADRNLCFTVPEEPMAYRNPFLLFNTRDEIDFGTTRFGAETFMHGPLHPLNRNRRDSFVAHLRNAHIVPGVVCVLDEAKRLVHPNSYLDATIDDLHYYAERSPLMAMNRRVHHRNKVEHEWYVDNDLPVIEVEEPHILVSAQSSSNIYHWLIESITRFWIFDEFPGLKALKLIVHSRDERKVRLVTDALGIPPENLTVLDRRALYRFRHLVFPSALCDLLNNGRKFDLIRRFFELPPAALAARPANPARYYVTRSDTEGRHVAEEDRLLAALEPHGIRKLVMSQHGLHELARMFAEAELLVGPMGSGLINMIFMPPGGAVVELASKDWSGLFWAMGCGAGHDYHVVGSEWDSYLCNGSKPFVYGMPEHMAYDVAKVEQVVRQAIAGIGRMGPPQPPADNGR